MFYYLDIVSNGLIMAFTDQESRYQEQLWFSHVTELSLTCENAKLLVSLITDLMDKCISDDDRIVLHFSGEEGMNSDRFPKYTLDRITTLLDCSCVTVPRDAFTPDRLIEAHKLVNYHALINDIMK